MSGLVNGLQNRLRRFESARHLTTNSRNPLFIEVSGVFFLANFKFCSAFVAHNKKAEDNPHAFLLSNSKIHAISANFQTKQVNTKN